MGIIFDCDNCEQSCKDAYKRYNCRKLHVYQYLDATYKLGVEGMKGWWERRERDFPEIEKWADEEYRKRLNNHQSGGVNCAKD